MQFVRIRQITVPLKIKNDVVFNISHSLKISALQKLIKKELHVDVSKQKLYYGGKQLTSDHSIADYKINNNDVIQLMVTTGSLKQKLTKFDETKSRNDDIITTTSKYYKIDDLIDVVYKEIGAWFEAKIVGIYSKVNSSVHEEDLLFQVVMDREEQTAPLNVNFHDIRPRARYLHKFSELKTEMTVFVNFNINKPKETGYWYDFKIEEINNKKCTLIGTLMLGGHHSDLPNCTIKFTDDVMKPEKPSLISERKNESESIPLRKLPLYCKKCKDISEKDCKECSCNICGKKNFIDKLIICDECEYTYHLFCLQPPLSNIPTEPEWYCPDCKNDENEIIKPGENLKKVKNGKDTKMQVKKSIRKSSFGPVLGVPVGTVWNDKAQIFEAGIHTTVTSNICGGGEGVYSIILENEHEILQDCGEEFYYTISSRSHAKQQTINTEVFIRNITTTAKHLTLNCNNYKKENYSFGKADIWEGGKPVRVVRSSKLRNISKFAPESEFRYDGLYKVVEYFPDIDTTGYIVWRFLMKRDDPDLAPWMPMQRNFVSIVRTSEEQQSKKPKMENFQIGETISKFINGDNINEKLWNECVEVAELGKEAFVQKVKEMFTCVCCQDVAYMPVTTNCKHNICHGCLKKCLNSEIYYCPSCRLKVEKKIESHSHHSSKMSAPQHHFMPGLNNSQQGALRNQFSTTMQNPMGNAMQNQLGNQMPVHMQNTMGNQISNPMIAQMASTLNNSGLNPAIQGNNQLLGQLNQQYAINQGNQMAQHQGANQLQMQQGSMEFSSNLQHHAMQTNQSQVMQQTPTGVAPTPPVQAQQQQQQSKEFNTASLCRIGQETVQDIVSRTQEVFQTLKSIQPPNGTPQSSNASNEKKAKVQEQLRTIRVLFKRLRLIYEKCNENCQLQGMEYTHIESLIPFKDEHDPKHDEKKNSEAYRLSCEECKEVMEQVILKNKQLKDVIDHLRRIIWEINTMLTMRRS